MSTIKTTNITHGSNSGTANLVLASSGNVILSTTGYATTPNAPYAAVGISSTQAVANTTSYLILWDTEIVNRNSFFNATNERFVAPVAGEYLACLDVQFTEQVNQLHTGILKNGTNPGTNFDAWSNHGDDTRGHSRSAIITLAVNDYITFQCYHSTGSSKNLETNRTKGQVRFLG